MATPAFSVIVPIFEETDALTFSNYYFNKLSLRPIYALDSKRIQRRAEVEYLLGREVSVYENTGNCIEASYDKLAALAPTEWVLRIDCDEVPNRAMIEHCSKFVARPTDSYCGFDRDDLIWRSGQLDRMKYEPLFVDTQFRLFNRNRVKFLSRIHTPGFHVPKWKIPFLPRWNAPQAARIYHLQRVFITAQQRAEKLARYNSAGQGPKLNDWIARPDDSFKWQPFADDHFTKLFAEWQSGQKS